MTKVSVFLVVLFLLCLLNLPQFILCSLLFSKPTVEEQETRIKYLKQYDMPRALSDLPSFIESTAKPAVLLPFDLTSIKVTGPSFLTNASALNLKYLHYLEADRLLYNYMVTANLSTNATSYGGWESSDSIIRGEFISMYLTACMKAYQSFGDEAIKAKAFYMVSQLKRCQDAIGTGYLSAFPSIYFDYLENLEFDKVQSTYYMIMHLMEGLYNLHLIGNKDAMDMISRMTDYHLARIRKVIEKHSIYRWQLILSVEFGDMAGIQYILYNATKDKKYKEMGLYFEDPSFLGPLAIRQDALTTLHANTHIPQAQGAGYKYEILGDEISRDILLNFWDFVVTDRGYATGGSNGGNGSDDATLEHWGDPDRLLLTLFNDNQEFCTQFNILIVSRTLMMWTGDIKYSDHYERAMYNGIWGNQYPDHLGVMLYYTPLGSNVSKAAGAWAGYGTPENSFWCCYATGVIQWSKMGDSIYFKDAKDEDIYVNLYFGSEVIWTRNQQQTIQLVQDSKFPQAGKTRFIVASQQDQNANSVAIGNWGLVLHIPYWLFNTSTLQVRVNNVLLKLNTALIEPSSWLVLGGPNANNSIVNNLPAWKTGDVIDVDMPMTWHVSQIIDSTDWFSLMYGPLVMVGLGDSSGISLNFVRGSDRFSYLSKCMSQVDAERWNLNSECIVGGNGKSIEFIPLYRTVTEMYSVYWNVLP